MSIAIRSPEVTDPVLLDFAAQVGADGPVAVAGGRTRWDVGGALAADTEVLTAPAGVVDYRPEEMTIQVRAGTTVADLDAHLADAGQRCALPERGGTVGGALVVGENDLRQLGRGRVRETLLQVRYVTSDGQLVTGGGPTVKNVTGFDLPRLMVGSLGTLGLLCEVILRTNPIPASSVILASTNVDPFAVPATVLRPSVVLWDGTTTWVELEGHEPEVAHETSALAAIGTFEEVDSLPVLPSQRWSLAPGDLRALASHDTGRFVASVGVGTVFAERSQPARTPDPVASMVAGRMKAEFDPTGRINPGRVPGAR